MPVALPILFGALAGAISGSLAIGATTASIWTSIAIGALLGALTIGLSFVTKSLSNKRSPVATNTTEGVQVTTFTRTGTLPVVFGVRRVGANCSILGALAFVKRPTGIDQAQQARLVGRVCLAVAEGPVKQVLGLFREDTQFIFPEQYTWTRGDGTNSALLGFEAYVRPEAVPYQRRTCSINVQADFGLVSSIPAFSVLLRGIVPERITTGTHAGGFTPAAAYLDGHGNRFVLTSTAGITIVTVPLADERDAVVESIAWPFVGATKAWYIGVIDTVLVQKPSDPIQFAIASREAAVSGDWSEFAMAPSFQNAIVASWVDDRSARVHFLQSDAAGYRVYIRGLVDMHAETIQIPPEIAPRTIVAWTYKPEDRTYYFVTRHGTANTACSYSVSSGVWSDIAAVDAGALGIVKLGVYLWVFYPTVARQINIVDNTAETIAASRFLDTDHDLGGSPIIAHVSQCGSRYAGVLLMTGGGKWRVQVVYGPLRAGEVIGVPTIMSRIVGYMPATGVRIPRHVDDNAPFWQTTWKSLTPALTSNTIDDVVERYDADYLTRDPSSPITTQISTTDSAGGKVFVYYYWPTKKNVGLRVVWLLWLPASNQYRVFFTTYQGEHGNWSAAFDAFRIVTPEVVYRQALNDEELTAPIYLKGRAVRKANNITGTLANPDAAVRSFAVSVQVDIADSDPIYRADSYSSGHPLSTSAPDADLFPPGVAIKQHIDNQTFNTVQGSKDVASSLQEAEAPGYVMGWPKTISVQRPDGSTITLATGASTAHWDTVFIAPQSLPAETRHPMMLNATSWRMDFWQNRVTPASEEVEIATNSIFGRGLQILDADDDESEGVAIRTHLSLHGFSREYIAVPDDPTQDTTLETRDDAFTLYAVSSNANFSGDHVLFRKKRTSTWLRAPDATAGGGWGGIAAGGGTLFSSAANGDGHIVVAYPTTAAFGVVLGASGQAFLASETAGACTFVGPCVRVSNNLRDKIIAFLYPVSDHVVKLRIEKHENGAVTTLAESDWTLQLPGTAAVDNNLSITLEGPVNQLTARVKWPIYGWEKELVVANTDLQENTRAGIAFTLEPASPSYRVWRRLRYTRRIRRASTVRASISGQSNLTPPGLRYIVPTGWRSTLLDAGATSSLAAGYSSATNPSEPTVDTTSLVLEGGNARATKAFLFDAPALDEPLAVESLLRAISSGDDSVLPCFRVSADRKSFVRVEYTRQADATVLAHEMVSLLTITIVQFSAGTRSVLQSYTFGTTAGDPPAPTFPRSSLLRWEMADDIVYLMVNGVSIWQSSAVTALNAMTGTAVDINGDTAGAQADTARLVQPTFLETPANQNPVSVIERYNWNHAIVESAGLADQLDQVRKFAFAFDIGRPNQIAVGFESGFSEPIMVFDEHNIRAKTLQTAIRSNGVAPNRVVGKFYNAQDDRGDVVVVNLTNDQTISGVRTLDVEVETITDRTRVLAALRQYAEAGLTDRLSPQWGVDVVGRVLEPGDVVRVSDPLRSFVNKTVRVEKVTDNGDGVILNAVEITAYSIDTTALFVGR